MTTDFQTKKQNSERERERERERNTTRPIRQTRGKTIKINKRMHIQKRGRPRNEEKMKKKRRKMATDSDEKVTLCDFF